MHFDVHALQPPVQPRTGTGTGLGWRLDRKQHVVETYSPEQPVVAPRDGIEGHEDGPVEGWILALRRLWA